MPEPKSEIVLGKETPSATDKARYQQQINSARAGLNKAADPVGVVPRPKLPNLAEIRAAEAGPDIDINSEPSDGGVKPRPPGSPVLRKTTVDQISGMAKELEKEAHTKKEEPKNEPLEEETASSLFAELLDSPETEVIRIMSSKKRRLDIESRCQPMKFEDLLIKNEVRQVVPILPGKFEAVFRSITPEENLFIKILMSKEKVTTDSYVAEKFSLFQLAFSLVSINGVDLPSHLDQYGEPQEQLVAAKVKVIQKKSGYIIADLHQNYVWFDMRVRRLFSQDELKNG